MEEGEDNPGASLFQWNRDHWNPIDDGILPEPRACSIGYHPPTFSETFFARMDQALGHIDQHIAAADAGPVVYARMSDLALLWPAPYIRLRPCFEAGDGPMCARQVPPRLLLSLAPAPWYEAPWGGHIAGWS
jgi:hypothetical protein